MLFVREMTISLRKTFPASLRSTVALAFTITSFAAASIAQTGVILHTFGEVDGSTPSANLVSDRNGNLYGTTWSGGNGPCGGTVGCGVIFEEAAPATSTGTWTYSVLYNFTGGHDGCCQLSTLAIDPRGNLYGVTNEGAPGGSIFRLAPPDARGGMWKFDLLRKFNDPTTFSTWTPLLIDKAGNLYAASFYGGKPGCSYSEGCGAVVQFVPPATIGGPWSENTVYQFQGAADGGNPFTALVPGPNGVFYGAADVGGLVTSSCPLGCGVIYQLAPPASSGGNWTESVIYTFQGQPDGATPYSLTSGPDGSLYGLACCHGTANAFHVFQLIPPVKGQTAWTKTLIHGFSNASFAADNIVMGSNGILYGAAFGDLDFNGGYVYQLAPPAIRGGLWTFTSYPNLGGSQNPNGVIQATFGALYGTLNGGDSDYGAVFELQP